MQYQVPQFIESDAKIVGPLTLKQFFYLAGAAAILFGAFFIFTFPLFIIVGSIVGGLAAALAFLKINSRPLPILLRFMVGYVIKPRLYLWQQPNGETTPKPEAPKEAKTGALKNLFLALITSTRPIKEREKERRPFSLWGRGEPQTRWQPLRHTTGERDIARRVDYR